MMGIGLLIPQRGPGNGNSSVAPTVASGSVRAMVPFTVGASGALNVTSARVYDFSNIDITAPELEYFNGWVSATIVGSAQEIATGTETKLKLSLLTGVNATQANTAGGYNQSGATLTACTWTLLAADSTGTTGRIMKLDDSVQPPTFVAKTFAQMQTDGGALTGNQLTVPSGYYVRTDPVSAATLAARTAYAVQIEEDRPVSQTASAAVLAGTVLTVTVPTTARYKTGNKLSLAGFTPTTYNTTAGTPVPITVVNATTLTLELKGAITVSIASPGVVTDPTHGLVATDQVILTWTGSAPTGLVSGNTYFVKTVLTTDTYTVSATSGGAVINTSGSQSGYVTRTKTGIGAVSVLGSVQANKPLIARAQSTVASNAFGDIITTNATTAAVSNTSTNWSAVSTAATADGVSMSYVARIHGTSIAGKRTVSLFGDSIAAQVNDENQANPTGAFLKGDQYGGLAAFKRAMNISGYPYFSVAVPTTLVGTVNTYGGNLVRQWIARGCSAIISEDVHNQVFAVTTLAELKAAEQAFWATLRTTYPGVAIVAITPSPTTAQVSASQWNARTAGAQSQSGGFIFPTGIAYTYRDYLMGSLVPANGDPDKVIDFAQLISNALAGTFVAIDGYWPSDGTAFWGTGDGTHPTLNTHAAAATAMAPLLPAALGFSP